MQAIMYHYTRRRPAAEMQHLHAGPTEASVCTTSFLINKYATAASVPIGG